MGLMYVREVKGKCSFGLMLWGIEIRLEDLVAQDRNTYEKRHRETKKRQKAEEKRARRQRRKDAVRDTDSANGDDSSLNQQ